MSMIAFRLYAIVLGTILSLIVSLNTDYDLISVLAVMAFIVAIDQWAQNTFMLLALKQIQAAKEEDDAGKTE